MEELKILQTLMVLVSCLDFVHGELLAKVPVSDILVPCSVQSRSLAVLIIRRLFSAFNCIQDETLLLATLHRPQ